MKKNRVGQGMLWGLCVAVATLSASPTGAVTYEVGTSVPLLPPEFYDGSVGYTHPFVPSVSIPTAPLGRTATDAVANPTGTLVAFRTTSFSTDKVAIMAVELATGFIFPLTVENLEVDGPFTNFGPLSISPDGVSVYANVKLINAETTEQINILVSGGFPIFDVSLSSDGDGRFGVGIFDIESGLPGQGRWIAVGHVNEDGSFDETSPAGFIGKGFGADVILYSPRMSPDGDKISFSVDRPGSEQDAYVIEGVLAMVASGLTSGVYNDAVLTGFSDPRVLDIRASDTTNFVFAPFFDFTGDLLIYAEDVTGNFDVDDIFGSLPISDFDIFMSNSDNSATLEGGGTIVSGGDMQFESPGTNEGMTGIILDGRILLQALVGGDHIELFVAPVTASEPIVASAGGSLTDLAGTTLTLEANQLEASLTLEIMTPTDTNLIQSVSAEFDEIIMGLRQFGPTTAIFDPPLTIVISYTEDQVLALDPETLGIVVIDPGTGVEIASFNVTNLVNDTEANTISFDVTTFGVTGARRGGLVPLTIAITGAERGGPLPASTPPWLVVLAALMLAAGALSIALRRRNAE